MGMFDSLYGTRNDEWQTKALGRSMNRYVIDDPVKLLLRNCQIEVVGGPSDRLVHRFATVRNGILTQVPDYRRPELRLVGYYGDLVEDETPTVSIVITEADLRAVPGDDLVINAAGHVWQRERGENWWRSPHKSAMTSMSLARFGPFFRVQSSARLMDPETLAGAISEAWQNADTSEWYDTPSTGWIDYAVAVLATPDLF